MTLLLLHGLELGGIDMVANVCASGAHIGGRDRGGGGGGGCFRRVRVRVAGKRLELVHVVHVLGHMHVVVGAVEMQVVVVNVAHVVQLVVVHVHVHVIVVVVVVFFVAVVVVVANERNRTVTNVIIDRRNAWLDVVAQQLSVKVVHLGDSKSRDGKRSTRRCFRVRVVGERAGAADALVQTRLHVVSKRHRRRRRQLLLLVRWLLLLLFHLLLVVHVEVVLDETRRWLLLLLRFANVHLAELVVDVHADDVDAEGMTRARRIVVVELAERRVELVLGRRRGAHHDRILDATTTTAASAAHYAWTCGGGGGGGGGVRLLQLANATARYDLVHVEQSVVLLLLLLLLFGGEEEVSTLLLAHERVAVLFDGQVDGRLKHVRDRVERVAERLLGARRLRCVCFFFCSNKCSI